MKLLATMQALDETHGAIRVEAVYDTDIEDLWEACTKPERLVHWIAEVSGNLREGGTVHATYTSTASGSARIEVCEAPHHLLLVETGEREDLDGESRTEAWLSEEESGTRLVIEERGLPADKLHFYGAGWQVHLEDLGRALATGASAHPDGWSDQRPAPRWDARWQELIPAYEEVGV